VKLAGFKPAVKEGCHLFLSECYSTGACRPVESETESESDAGYFVGV